MQDQIFRNANDRSALVVYSIWIKPVCKGMISFQLRTTAHSKMRLIETSPTTDPVSAVAATTGLLSGLLEGYVWEVSVTVVIDILISLALVRHGRQFVGGVQAR